MLLVIHSQHWDMKFLILSDCPYESHNAVLSIPVHLLTDVERDCIHSQIESIYIYIA